MISRNSSGSICSDSAVEPTMSQNITVICRRSALSPGSSLDDTAATVGPPAAMAVTIARRGPSGSPSCFKSSSLNETTSSGVISSASNALAYFSSPRSSSQARIRYIQILPKPRR